MTHRIIHTTFRKYGIALVLVWTAILAGFISYMSRQLHENMLALATGEARNYYKLNIHYRRWSSKIGGVYAVSSKVEPNPHLTVPDRDVITESGTSLTLVNPAYMTRMVFEAIQKDSDNPIISRIVSLKPINPANAPNPWELETLNIFESSLTRERIQLLTIENRPYLQFMTAFITEESCLKCHAKQGYKVGDIRGGMSIAIPISEYLTIEAERNNSLAMMFSFIWILGTAGISFTSRRRYLSELKLEEERNNLENEVHERMQIQEQLEQQAILLEEESAERQKAVESLMRTENFLQTIIDTEPECVKLLDQDCQLLFMNQAGLNMIEAESLEQIKGQNIMPLISEAYRHKFEEVVRYVFLGESKSIEFEVVGLKGKKIWMQSTSVPFRNESGSIVAVLAITRDVTELKRTMTELQKKNSDIEQFIYTTSHDLRTPLVTVKAFLGFLEKDMAAQDQTRIAQDLQFIHGAADKMKDLLDELLELSRNDLGEIRMEQVTLRSILDEVLDSLAAVIKEQHVEIVRLDADLPLFGDRSRMCQIWLNLIENAVKYSRENSRPRIELGLRSDGGETVFFVRDNGIGIAPDYRDKIFNMFEKLDSSSPGAGLGLSMIKRIVEKCGGRIWVESEGLGHGSCFCFTLPLSIASG